MCIRDRVGFANGAKSRAPQAGKAALGEVGFLAHVQGTALQILQPWNLRLQLRPAMLHRVLDLRHNGICLLYTSFEALSALMDMLHDRYPAWEFICFTDPENLPSMALLRKLGYEPLGYVPSKQSNAFGKWIRCV